MLEHCDFAEQATVSTDDGRLRPDLIVHLPGHKVVVVDSKSPLQAYLDATEERDEPRRGALLDQHARQVRTHIEQLAEKDYANELTEAPDFVVMFLPGEAFFSEACRRDPGLIEFAVNKGVIPASPTTLITILKAVSYGWRQERIGQNAERIRDLGIELYDRLRTTAEHLETLRRSLAKSVESYNSAVGSLESRVLPTARKLRELGAADGPELALLEPVVNTPREIVAEELT
jgi:DNA recombination protein RmuC